MEPRGSIAVRLPSQIAKPIGWVIIGLAVLALLVQLFGGPLLR